MKGRVLATPDCIVRIVDIPAPTAPYVPPPTLPPITYPPARCDVRGSVQAYADSYGRCECKVKRLFKITSKRHSILETECARQKSDYLSLRYVKFHGS